MEYERQQILEGLTLGKFGKCSNLNHQILKICSRFFPASVVLGYDTTALTMSYAGYHLCKNPEILKQLQEEVDLAYDEANGETPDYNVVQV